MESKNVKNVKVIANSAGMKFVVGAEDFEFNKKYYQQDGFKEVKVAEAKETLKNMAVPQPKVAEKPKDTKREEESDFLTKNSKI